MQMTYIRPASLAGRLVWLLALMTPAVAGRADLVLTLDQSAFTVQQGDAFNLTAGIVNTELPGGAAFVVDNYSLKIDPIPPTSGPLNFGPAPNPDPTQLGVDDTGFFTSFQRSFAPGDSLPSGTNLLNFAVGSLAPVGQYDITVTLNDANGTGLSQGSFDLTINPASGPSVPEIGTLPLLSALLTPGGVLLLRRRNRRR